MLKIKAHRHFDNLDEAWYECYLCKPIMYPRSELIKHEGQLYCREHYRWRFPKKQLDETRIRVKDELSGSE